MARLVTGPPKYTPHEWHHSNHANYDRAEQERKHGERIRDESSRLIDETRNATENTQNDVNKKIRQRLNDIDFWKAELNRQCSETDDEIRTMTEYKTRLEHALAATQQPLDIAHACLSNREHRVAIDVVHDDVEIQLLKEVEVIKGVQAVLQKTLDQAVEQIRLLRSANYYLNKDITDKFSALKIDGVCEELTNASADKSYVQNAVKVPTGSTTPEEWEAFSNKNLLKAESERNTSVTLRSMTDEILQETFNDMQKQFSDVNLSFVKRIEETEKAKGKLEDHLAKVNGEITDMETNINSLREAINDKEAPMQVSQTRLATRTRRPNTELCRDRVQYRLVDEVGEISCNINRLVSMLHDSETSLKDLIRQKLNLEEDIAVKTRTLEVDRDLNVLIREEIKHKHY